MGRMARGQEALGQEASGKEALAKGSMAALAALLGANVALSFGGWFVRLADVGPVAAAWWRMGLAAPLLFLLARAFADRDTDTVAKSTASILEMRVWAPLVLCGLFFAADLAAWHLGLLQTKLANANLLGNAASFLFPIYGFLVAKSWPSRTQSLALLLAAVGSVLLLGRSYELSSAHLIGDLLSLLAGVCYMIFLIFVDRIRNTMGAWSLHAWTTLASAFPLLILALILGEKIMPSDWTPIILLTVGSQIIGQSLLLLVIGRLSPLIIGLALLLQPIISAIVGYYAYGETMSPLDWAGAGLIAAALLLIRR
jgi:drug/metabolite transporter (DMT)-like permease